MDEIEILRNIFQCIRASRTYQNDLRTSLIEIDNKIKTISIIKKQKSKKPQNQRPKRPPKPKIPIHPCYKLQNFLKKLKNEPIPTTKEFSTSEINKLRTLYEK